MTITRSIMIVAALASAIACASADQIPRHNAIIFVADGLRAGSVNPIDAPTMWSLEHRGVMFTNTHSLFPTFTTPNASAIATGHALGDTGDFSNFVYTGFPAGPAGKPPTLTPYLESDSVLGDIDERVGGNFVTEETLLALARQQGFLTAAIGKQGPALIQDVTQGNKDATGKVPVPQTIVIDDATGRTGGIPLSQSVADALSGLNIPTQAFDRSNKADSKTQASNSYTGDNQHPGTLAANVVQQQQFADALTQVVLPAFKQNGRPFVIVFWSRDPDGTQHNEGDSLNSLIPGINGPTSKAAIKNADGNLAQILRALEREGLSSTTDIFVTADHGFDTISKRQVDSAGTATSSYAASFTYVDASGRQTVNSGFLPCGFLAIDLAHALNMPLYDPDTIVGAGDTGCYKQVDPAQATPGGPMAQRPVGGNGLVGGSGKVAQANDAKIVIASNGGSDLIYIPGKPDKRDPLPSRIVAFLCTQDYVSGVFVNDAYGPIPGALPMSSINLIGEAKLPQPAIVVNFASFATSAADPFQSGVIIADNILQQGQGQHGGFDRSSTLNFMAALGPDFRNSLVDEAPVGNADVAPTIAKLLGIEMPSQGKLSGRIISEALNSGSGLSKRDVKRGTTRSQPGTNGCATILNWQEYHGERYFDAAGFAGRTNGL